LSTRGGDEPGSSSHIGEARLTNVARERPPIKLDVQA
jgi:hypothetical protein